MIPSIEFRRSAIYDNQFVRPEKFKNPPSRLEWLDREKQLQTLWKKHGATVLRLMSKVTGLPWREDKIIAYLTWGVRPFSDPLTISLREDVFGVFETLTHELIHRICSEPKNWERIQKSWKAFVQKYPKEIPLAINHVPIHAVHEILWETLFPKRVANLKRGLKLKPYIRSWKLVEQIGASKVIKNIFY